MAEISETMVQILERITATHEQLIEILQRMEERQREHNLTLAKAIGENSRALQQSLGHIADVLKYVAETTSRTERMTAEVLARLASPNPAH